MRPAAAPVRGIVPPNTPAAKAPEKKNPLSFIVGVLALLGVGGLISYGYLPSRQSGEPKKPGGEADPSAVIASGDGVKNLREAVTKTPVPAPTPAAKPSQAPTAKPTPVTVPTSVPAKPVVSKPAPVKAVPTATPKAAPTPRAVPTPEVRRAAPKPRREAPKPPAARPVPAATPAAAVAEAPPVRKPVAAPKLKPVVVKAAPKPKPAANPQQLPKASRSSSESIESDGTNPLGLPQ